LCPPPVLTRKARLHGSIPRAAFCVKQESGFVVGERFRVYADVPKFFGIVIRRRARGDEFDTRNGL
jgi:hypothetical protein